VHQTCLSKNFPAHGTVLNLIIQIPTQSFDEEQPNSSSKDITSTNLFEPRATSSSSTDVIGSPENTGSNAYRKLYEGSLMTVESSCITINKFIHKHHLSKQAQEDLLSLQQQLLPTPNWLPHLLYRFQQVVNFGKYPIKLYHYCPKCFAAIHPVEQRLAPTTSLCYPFAHS